MTDSNINSDKDIATRFAMMRDEEREKSPKFPSEFELRKQQAALAPKPGIYEYMPKIAAAFALVAIISIFMTNASNNRIEENPVEVYARIMQSHNMDNMNTDHLLVVSESLLPAMASAPTFYETELELEPDLYLN